MMSPILNSYISKVDLQVKPSISFKKKKEEVKKGVLQGDGKEEERDSCLLILRFAAAANATPQPVSWLQREASGRA